MSEVLKARGIEVRTGVRLREEDRSRVMHVGDVLVSTPGGQVVPAKNLMVVGRDTGPVEIERKNQERIARVSAETEITLSDAVQAVQNRLGQIRVPPDFSVGFGAEVEEQARSFQQLQLVLVLAIMALLG